MTPTFDPKAPAVGIWPGIPHETYLRAPGLSRSRLKTLLSSTPHEFKHAESTEETPSMRLGTALHLAVLEQERFAELVRPKPKNDMRTNAGKAASAAWDEANPGKIAVPEAEYALAVEAARMVRSKRGPATALREGDAELSMWWDQGGVLCKSRADFCSVDRGFVCDIKVTQRDLSDKQVIRVLVDQYAACQLAMQYAAVHALTGKHITPYVLLIQLEPPIDMRLIHVTEPWLLYGEAQFLEGLRIYNECTKTGEWWGYADVGVTSVPLPQWIQRETEQLNAKAAGGA